MICAMIFMVYAEWIQAASFNYEMLYRVARAISDEVRAKVKC